jgi:hypothetical protein
VTISAYHTTSFLMLNSNFGNRQGWLQVAIALPHRNRMCIRIGHMIEAVNGLKVCASAIGNAFFYGTTREMVYIMAGQEFGNLSGRPLIIDRGLYGLQSSSARFHEHLSTKLRSMGY